MPQKHCQVRVQEEKRNHGVKTTPLPQCQQHEACPSLYNCAKVEMVEAINIYV